MKSFLSKTLSSGSLILLFIGNTIAQDNELKNFRFGLKVTPMINWMRPDIKGLEKNGSSIKFGYGLMLEFRLNKVISFATGIGGDYDGGKLSFKDSASYYVFDDALITAKEAATKITANDTLKLAHYLLKSREYTINYVNIPVTLKMKSGDIGGITYYGLFGGDIGIRTKAKANDETSSLKVPPGVSFDGKKVDITKDMGIIRINLNVSAGIEYNLSGSTSFVAGINYRRGFLSALKTESEYLIKGSTGATKFKQSAPTDAIMLTVGILF